MECKTMSFEDILMEAIDEALSSFGKTCQQAIYFHLEKEFKLNKREIPCRIKHFTEAIETIFGYGAKILEIRIMENLFKKMGYTNLRFQDRKNLEFTQYIEAAKNNNNYWMRGLTPLMSICT